MNTFLYVLLAWIVVLFIANKLLARRKPNTVKILVQRNGKAAEVDAVVVQVQRELTTVLLRTATR